MKRLTFFIFLILLLGSCATESETSDNIVEPAKEIEQVASDTSDEADDETSSKPIKVIVRPAPRGTPSPKNPVKKTEAEPKIQLDPTKEKSKELEVVKDPNEEVVATFGDVTITKQDYIETKLEISDVVDDLNEITATNDYNRWLKYLSDEYIEYFSSPSVLTKSSKALPVKNIRLRNLRDYFKFVFVPSRKNIRVDDIKFVSATAVNVIMRTNHRSLLVYILEEKDGKWKLVPKS